MIKNTGKRKVRLATHHYEQYDLVELFSNLVRKCLGNFTSKLSMASNTVIHNDFMLF
jgi:hypothetical protein